MGDKKIGIVVGSPEWDKFVREDLGITQKELDEAQTWLKETLYGEVDMSNEEFVVQDTKGIQIQSVCAFMEQFNYLLHVDGKFYSNTFWDWEKGGRDRPTFKGCEVISFNKACELHNSEWSLAGVDSEGCKVEAIYMSHVFTTDTYTLNKAMANKIVEQVFLQGTKHGGVVCHKHLVKFCDSSYQYMFLEKANEAIPNCKEKL